MTCCEETYAPAYFDLFLPIAAGDSYPESISVAEDEIDLTLNRVLIEFRIDPASESADLSLDSEDDQITITSGSSLAWDFTILDFTSPAVAGDYSFKVVCFCGEDDRRRTIIAGNFQVS